MDGERGRARSKRDCHRGSGADSEAGTADRFDYLVVVTCLPEQRIQRLAQRLGMAEESARAEVARRMAAQFSDAKKIEAADFVIDNSGSLASTEQQVGNVFSALRRSGR